MPLDRLVALHQREGHLVDAVTSLLVLSIPLGGRERETSSWPGTSVTELLPITAAVGSHADNQARVCSLNRSQSRFARKSREDRARCRIDGRDPAYEVRDILARRGAAYQRPSLSRRDVATTQRRVSAGVRRSPSVSGISAAISLLRRMPVMTLRDDDPPPISSGVASRHPTTLFLAVRPLQPVHPPCELRAFLARRSLLATLRSASAVADGCQCAGPRRSLPRAALRCCRYPPMAWLFRDARCEVLAYIWKLMPQ